MGVSDQFLGALQIQPTTVAFQTDRCRKYATTSGENYSSLDNMFDRVVDCSVYPSPVSDGKGIHNA